MLEKETIITAKQQSLAEYPYNFLLTVMLQTDLEFPTSISKDIRAGIQYAFSTLEEEQQEILRLRYAERKTTAEAAACLSVSEEEVLRREQKAIKTLRLPARWNYIRYGVAGYMRKKISEAHNRAYQLGYCDGYQNGARKVRDGDSEAAISEDLLDQPIEKMGLSVLAYNCLKYAGLERIRDVVYLSKERVRTMRGLGTKKADEIARAVQGYGIHHTAWDRYLL